jgi:hypothetical protein
MPATREAIAVALKELDYYKGLATAADKKNKLFDAQVRASLELRGMQMGKRTR